MTSPQPSQRRFDDIAAVFDVAQAVALLSKVLTDHTPQVLEVTGVVSSWRNQKGWVSGELCQVTNGNVEARIPFNMPTSGLPPYAAMKGAQIGNDCVVTVTGSLRVAPPWNLVRLHGTAMVLVERVSKSAAARELMVAAMREDGTLDRQKLLRLPPAPETVGLITAAASAARADVMNSVVSSRAPIRIVELNVTLTGVGADRQIVVALERIVASRPEVIVLARGGGPTAELATFDSPLLAAAIAQCPIPVIAAIGHATDKTVADLLAHTSVNTPTAAAALLITGHQRARQEALDVEQARRLHETHQRAEAARKAALVAHRQKRAAVAALLVVVLVSVAAVLAAVLFL